MASQPSIEAVLIQRKKELSMKLSSQPRITMSLTFGCAILLQAAGIIANAAETNYLGTTALLQKVAENSAKASEPDEKQDDQSKFRAELDAFKKDSATLAPGDAAKRWLDLVDKSATLSEQSTPQYSHAARTLSGEDLLGALPPPASWAELAKAIAARPAAKGPAEIREIGLRLLAVTLT